MTNTVDEYRELRQEDLPGLCPLMRKTFQTETTEAYWRWKFFENPLHENASFVALCGERLIGFAGAVPYRLKYGDRVIKAGHLVDLMVDPEWRGKNVFSLIMRMMVARIIQSMDVMYGFTNEKSREIFERFYDIAYETPRIDRPVRTEHLARKVIPLAVLSRWMGNAGDSVLRLLVRLHSSTRSKGIYIQSVDRFDSGVDALWEDVSTGFEIAAVRDRAYLNWRYSDHPIYKYKMFTAEGDPGSLLGFVVLRCHHFPDAGPIGLVVDFLVRPDRADAARALLAHSIQHFQTQGVTGVTGWMFPHSPWKRVFERSLFFPRKSKVIVLTTSFADNVDRNRLKDLRQWYITMGDRDSN
jgi:GNAT superfamily N-acetyltransferase